MEFSEPALTHDRPDYVKRAIKAGDGNWQLGDVVPDRSGFTLSGVYEGDDYIGALHFCEAEAADRGISGEAYEATVASSLGVNTFNKVLESIFKH